MDNILEANGLVKRYPTFTLDSIFFPCRRDVSPASSEPTVQGKPRRYVPFSIWHIRNLGQ